MCLQVVKATEVSAADLEGYDVIFAAGGDGTFLKTASRVTRDVPIVGTSAWDG
jgi:predicted polyphosphate/ATP-dependent NAD kinase